MRKHFAVGALALVAAGCGGAEAPAGPKRVVFVLVDTLRYDHVGRSGDPRGLTPRMDALAAEGVWFPRALAASSWTRPSVASMFTGLHPGSHGVEGNDDALSDEVPTLAQLLAAHGVATLAVSANAQSGRAFGLARGFRDFRVPLERRGYEGDASKIPGDVVVAKGLELLDGVREDESFFLFLHTVDPHDPYLAHPGLLDRPEPEGRYVGSRRDIVQLDRAALAGAELDERDLDRVRWYYEGEVRFADQCLGELLDGLAARGLLDDTLVVVVSDHGEELWAHGRRGHGYSLYQEVVHVPLILRFPPQLGVGGRECASLAHHVDLMPTLLAWYDVPAPRGLAGADLWPAIVDAASHPGPATVISQLAQRTGLAPTRARECVTDFHSKLIVGHDDKVEWYDLAADPRELDDRASAGEEPPRALRGALAAALAAVARARAEGVTIPWEQLGDAARADLQALGYAGD